MSNTKLGDLDRQIKQLGPWFHNLHLPDGTQTAPDHFLGDFPTEKWDSFRKEIPANLQGWTALDVGCNAGFYSFELARRGAEVTAVDCDPHYLAQAKWATKIYELEDRIHLEQKQIYDLAHIRQSYDLVWFMGILYHLRYPLLGLDIVARKARKLLVLQTMTSPGEEIVLPPEDMRLSERNVMLTPGWPQMAFIERRLERDPTNWWAPNHACVEAMVRSAGLEVVSRPAHEIYICRPANPPDASLQELLDAEFASATGTLQPREIDAR